MTTANVAQTDMARATRIINQQRRDFPAPIPTTVAGQIFAFPPLKQTTFQGRYGRLNATPHTGSMLDPGYGEWAKGPQFPDDDRFYQYVDGNQRKLVDSTAEETKPPSPPAYTYPAPVYTPTYHVPWPTPCDPVAPTPTLVAPTPTLVAAKILFDSMMPADQKKLLQYCVRTRHPVKTM